MASSTFAAAPSSNPGNRVPTATDKTASAKDLVADSMPTVEIRINSSIKAKVRQCLTILHDDSHATTPAGGAKRGRRKPKIVALRATHPSAASKTITVAEIAKRQIEDKEGGYGKGVWWQFTKVESKLVEWPSRKYKERTDKGKREQKVDEGETDLKDEAGANANKRKQNAGDERAAKRPKLGPSTVQDNDASVGETDRNPIAISSGSAPKPVDSMSPYPLGNDIDDDDVPPHLKPLSDSDDEMESDEKPPHLRDTTPLETPTPLPPVRPQAASSISDGRPPHMRDLSPESSDGIPPHLRNSSPGPRSDDEPPHLQILSSDDRPPHLRSSAPNTPFKVLPDPNHRRPSPIASIQSHENIPLTSSPPATSQRVAIESDSESTRSQPRAQGEGEEQEEDEDEYRQFTYLDYEHLPDKDSKKLLADLDEAERNRTKYRAMAIMTIYLSLEKRPDLESLHGCQTNLSENSKQQGILNRVV
ncbi:hypothetical protein H072_1988 [Dactylellina haptotyla CBS 200.50]|uniref:Uncharacterized protein n=1 Tax=Dactylellina haptotyla (strain CBS 200.50) TaxID=1284197 RepID=S8C8P0_DACHA|nr:hypothetical protein H072_1988 [Dactylellina haptotyla CBS 200.50]